MANDTPTHLKKPSNDTDPWVVATLTSLKNSVEFNAERMGYIRDDTKIISIWVKEHDQRHRAIDGKMAIIGVGIPVATGFIVWLITTLVGG